MFLIDIGNSRIKWSFHINGKFVKKGEAQYQKELEQQLSDAWGEVRAPEKVFIANVAAPKILKIVTTWISTQWKIDAIVITTTPECRGVTNAYLEPEKLGVDRWLAMLAAYKICGKETLMIDCGSALTIDALSATGEHLGGLILPGMQMMKKSLIKGASGVKIKNDPSEHVALFARDTEGAVIGGALYAMVAVIDRIVVDVRDSLGANVALVITGGDVPALKPLLAYKFQHEPDLVLQGLAMVAMELA